MRSIFLLVPLAFALGESGCSSTLDEYRCSVQADCDGESAGRCEMSGHCSFADGDCASGFRFGSGSGSESNTCVGDVQRSPDAAPSSVPIARINETELSCGETSGFFSGELSRASDGATLIDFSWRIRGLDDEVIDSFNGKALDRVPHGLHRLGGIYVEPNINLTPYHARGALRVDFKFTEMGGGIALYHALPPLGDGSGGSVDLDLALAVGLDSASSSMNGTVGLARSQDFSTISSQPITLTPGLKPYRVQFSGINTGDLSADMALVFVFNQDLIFWIDNVSLWEPLNGTQAIANGSLEEGSEPWMVLDSIPALVPATNEIIPEEMRRPGEYRIELKVTDSAGKVSALEIRDVEVEPCSDNF